MPEMTGAEKTIVLFNYIKEVSNIKNEIVRNINGQYWHLNVAELPESRDYITLNNRDKLENAEYDDIILEVQKPDLLICPEPDKIFRDWLSTGWDNPEREVSVLEYIKTKPVPEEDDEAHYIYFDSDAERFAAYEAWKTKRDAWAENQKERLIVRELFTTLHKLHVTMERDIDTKELMVGNGILTDRKDSALSHPIILKRIKTEFDALNNIIRFVDTDIVSELYTSLLTNIEDFNITVLPSFTEQLSINSCHPLDNVDTPVYLKELLHLLSVDSQYIDDPVVQRSERFQIRSEPVFFIRARRDGVPKAIEAIINDIKQNGTVPSHLLNLVGEEKVIIEEEAGEKSLPEQLAEVGGEDTEILLSKAANKEQLEIARRISKYDAVLVQGPPGTGKTHTIANLLGHFLAQGETVLVTSHTKKALTVLKEKVEEDLKALCVAVLDDNNSDMEKSVNTIIEMTSHYSVDELKNNIQLADIARQTVISELATVRQRIYDIRNSEYTPIVIGGESISTAAAARFVNQHPEYDIIPGKVVLRRVLPLSYEELQYLYNSNALISAEEEDELECALPDPELYPSPDRFRALVSDVSEAYSSIKNACNDRNCQFSINDSGFPEIKGALSILITNPTRDGLSNLQELIKNFIAPEEWMIYAAVDGRAGGGHTGNWNTLILTLQETVDYYESLVEESFGKKITFIDSIDFALLSKTIPKMAAATAAKTKLNKLDYIIHSDYKTVESMVQINGKDICCHKDYVFVEHQLKLREMRMKCESYWDQLLAGHGVTPFTQLSKESPECIAVRMIPQIRRCLVWYKEEFPVIKNALSILGISESQVFQPDTFDTDIDNTRKILNAVDSILPFISLLVDNYLCIEEISSYFTDTFATTLAGRRAESDPCKALYNSVKSWNAEAYRNAFQKLITVYNKYPTLEKRKLLLDKLYDCAPDWSYAIRTRSDLHGGDTVPQNINNAWLWKQYSGILDELTNHSLIKYQSDAIALSNRYRKKTAELAKWKAWCILKKRIEKDIKLSSALRSWSLTAQRIGIARRMNAIYRATARKHMIECQQAVPAWIMPMVKVFEYFTPGQNEFDVVIVDEASQSDIMALAVTYMAKKVIIVGDDKQVSPTMVGIDLQRMINLAEGLIKDIIPSWQLFTGNSSLYDIVSLVCPFFMLKEHFRCVPDIIGYSNMLSYDYKIKPLRDTSENILFPAIVNYRVNGHRDDQKKQNDVEARTIVTLIKACLERKEYDGKTFGIISLLGDEQPRLIEKYLFEQFEADVIDKRRIIYGTSAQFQGDERDVIFLSMVDSNESDGPLAKRRFGSDDIYRKRYNVAASRAKDQLWLVHSLDSNVDLQAEDIRKGLIDYTKNPKTYIHEADQVTAKAESPFEEMVGKALIAKGYSIVQQWPVGAYRIDMVVVDEKKRVAIECDGERWHSSEVQVRNDMERQTILERLGWRFIRIRGSEYFRNPESTMEGVCSEIKALDIHPNNGAHIEQTPDTNLLAEIKRRAEEILTSDDFVIGAGDKTRAIAAALDNRESVITIKTNTAGEPTFSTFEKPVQAPHSTKPTVKKTGKCFRFGYYCRN